MPRLSRHDRAQTPTAPAIASLPAGLSADEERSLADRAKAAELAAVALLEAVPAAARVLRAAKPGRARQPYLAQLGRVEAAVRVLREAAKQDAGLHETLLAVETHRQHAEALRWELAQSAIRIAASEARKLPRGFLDRDDLVQEGLIGLHRAARRFDPARGIRFGTYARWWARAVMARALEQTGKMVRLPGGAVEQSRNLRRVVAHYKRARKPLSVATLAAEAGVTVERAELLLHSHGVEHVEQVDDPEVWGRLLVYDADPVTAIDAQRLGALVPQLDPRQRRLIERRFGLDGDEPQNLQEIGLVLGVSRERTRQIEGDAFAELRHLRRSA